MDINDRSVIEVPLGLLWPIVFFALFQDDAANAILLIFVC